MTDYTKLIKALRDIEKTMFALGTSPINMGDVSIRLAYDKRWGQTAEAAAAAIEALQAQLPKRGEWLPYEFNTNGTWHKCSVCGVAYQYKDAPNSGWWINHNYCPNCGAKMMEVQDGQ